MEFVNFREANTHLVKPEDMTADQCGDIDAMRGLTVEGWPFVLVVVKPTDEDINVLLAGGGIAVRVLGNQFAPMSVFVCDHGEIL